ncbi:hypothetical protein RclHR1_06580011 [Rhizophagus clarus]|uniref:Zn(2)-C6 fungal-type domain-containing protein n=1 Tax=Rhizophagus clarus TaxID=94130 RepID=A0A2Z6SJ84_9GLOM|nr:hypothetical protein RclHR1_06580011 [Rhizophagus clarus]GES82923.1 hypothetical protein GLOIN_2v1589982 [Rhizophagus clarus]
MPCDRITRRNITTACNLCRKKKQRCNGGPVCSRCKEKKIKCDYPKPKKRGPPRNIEYVRCSITNRFYDNDNNNNNNNEVENPNLSKDKIEDPPDQMPVNLQSFDNVNNNNNQSSTVNTQENNTSNPYPFSNYPHFPSNYLNINPFVMITKESIENHINDFLYYHDQQNNEPRPQ